MIYSAGSMLARAGLLDESDALMTRELKRSHSPYYYMLALASNAKKRNTPAGNAAAIDWARQGYETSVGSATRLEWGALVRALPDRSRSAGCGADREGGRERHWRIAQPMPAHFRGAANARSSA